jgi:hypothetical protein
MNQTALEQMLSTGKVTSAEVLADAPLDALDEALTMLMRHRPAKEVCDALMERITRTPIEDLCALKGVYFKHLSASRNT